MCEKTYRQTNNDPQNGFFQSRISITNSKRTNFDQNVLKNSIFPKEDSKNGQECGNSNQKIVEKNQDENALSNQKTEILLNLSKALQSDDISDLEKKTDQNLVTQLNSEISKKDSNSTRIRYMQFKPYYDSLHQRKNELKSRGYYYKFINIDIKIVRFTLEENGFIDQEKDFDFTIMWTVEPIKPEIYKSLSFFQKVNHFPKSYEITRKDMMHRHISRMQATFGLKHFDFVPKTFILPSEMSLLIEDYERNKSKYYIVKPNALSQGQGIFVTDNIEKILPKQNTLIVVSHYIDDPYLIEGYKFDLRIYVAITSIHPLRIYMYEEGLARFATKKYEKENLGKGDNINKHSDELIFKDVDDADQASCKWSLKAFRKYLRERGVDVTLLFNRIEDLIIKTIISVESTILNAVLAQVSQRTNCFELLGFDVLIDSKLKPWLLEVNLSPSLACETALDQRIKADLISDLLTLIGMIPIDQRASIEPQLSERLDLNSHGIQPNQVEKRSTTYRDSLLNRLCEPSKEEKQIIKETDDEYERRGKFLRVFPNQNTSEYGIFFSGDRPYNNLLRAVIRDNPKNNIGQNMFFQPNTQFLSKEQAQKRGLDN